MQAQERPPEASARRGSAARPAAIAAAGALPHAAAMEIVALHAGPALLIDGDGAIVSHNAAAQPLAAAASAITELADRARSGSPADANIEVAGALGALSFDLIALPLAPPPARILVIGRDATVEHNLIRALISSRQLFKDIVACSADFSWETTAEGRFSFVSPRGALGFSAGELSQRRARRPLDPEHDPPEPLPFERRVAQDEEEVWVRQADGRPACLSVSCVPVYDSDGMWRGARGLCRDVMAAREREVALARARNRETLLGRIVQAMRNEVDPEHTLPVAAKVTAATLDVAVCWVMRC